MKTFHSKILTYPLSIREEIDSLFKKNTSLRTIQKFLRNYEKRIGCVPDLSTLERYGVGRGLIQSSTGSELCKSEAVLDDSSDLTIDGSSNMLSSVSGIGLIESKKEILENLVNSCKQRLNIISERQSNVLDKSWESLYKGYIEEVRQLVETLAKLSGELTEEKSIIVNVVQEELPKFFRLTLDVLKEICPEKVELFRLKFKERYQEQYQSKEV